MSTDYTEDTVLDITLADLADSVVEGTWRVYHNNVLTDCEVILDKTFHIFQFSLFLNRGLNSIKVVYVKDSTETISNVLYVNAYNIHLLLQMYALEFLDYFKAKEQIYSDQYLYDTMVSAQGLKENFASMLKLIREPDQDIKQFRSFITKGVESYWSALTIKGLSKLFEAYESNWGLKEYYKNRVKLSNTMKLSSNGSLNVFWPSQQVVLNKRHYYLAEGSSLLTANMSSYLYVDEETDANGYLLMRQSNILPLTVKVKIDTPIDYIEMQVKENISDFNELDWEIVTDYFVTNLAYNENTKFLYVKFRKANKEISPIYYKTAEYFLLGVVKTGASSIVSIDDGKVSMSSINTKLMGCHGFELFLEESFDREKQDNIVAAVKRLKLAHTKGYVIFDKKLPAIIV